MGIHVSIYSLSSGDEHPTWDWSRYTGDSDLPYVFSEIGELRRETRDGAVVVRPARPSELCARMLVLKPGINAERWLELQRILESSDDWWVHFG